MLLDPLEHEIAERLAEAGERGRASHLTGPDRAFSADLRDRLLAAASDPEAASGPGRGRASRVRVAWSLSSLLRVPRLVPVAAAALLLIAGVVAARELYVAIGSRHDATPTPAPSVNLVVPPGSVSESASAAETSAASADATPAHLEPTAKPTSKPTAVPTPGITAMTLAATGCDGGVVLDWSGYAGDWFNHYATLRNTSSNIPKAYPPQAGAVDLGGTHTALVGKTSAFDMSAVPGTTYWYRSMALKADGTVIGASSVVSAVAAPVASLGTLNVGPDAVEGTDLSWSAYGGGEGCFTWYKLVFSETNPNPSYLDGDPYLAAISSAATTSYVTTAADLVSGTAYHFRVQVIRSTDLGPFLVAQSDVTTYTIP